MSASTQRQAPAAAEFVKIPKTQLQVSRVALGLRTDYIDMMSSVV
jgi:hypothetical protein